MILPNDPDFVVDLILQRTRPYIALAGKDPLAEWTRTGRRDHLLPALGGSVEAYVAAAVAEIAADVDQYVELAAGRKSARLVSIGCGSGIAEALVCRALKCEAVLLVDVESGGSGHGFADEAAGYGNLQRAEALMRANGVTCEVSTWNPRAQPEPRFRFDLLLSIYAMGFHFPATAYDGFIERNRQPGALVIHDARPGRTVREAA